MAVLAVLALFSTTTDSQDAIISVIDLSEAGTVSDLVPNDQFVVRSERIDINVDALYSFRDERRGQSTLINLFDGVTYEAVFDFVESDERGLRMSGMLKDEAFGSIVLAVRGGTVSGTVRTFFDLFEIRTLSDNVYVVSQMDPTAFPDEAEPLLSQQGQGRPNPDPLSPTTSNGGSIITIWVAYTTAARESRGGQEGIETFIDNRVDETRLAFARSEVNADLVLLGTEEVEYGKTDPSEDIRRLSFLGDGYLDGLQDRRDRAAADLIHLIIDGYWPATPSRRAICGAAPGILDPDDIDPGMAYSISGTRCNLTFTHEIGHLLGLDHDEFAVSRRASRGGMPPAGAYTYSYGYVNVDEGWRTIMAYHSACADVLLACPRIGLFSNPRTSHPTTMSSMGSNSADAARSLNQTVSIVAGFR